MPMPARKPPPPDYREPTYADILALPDPVVGQIIDGELVALPWPRSSRAVATSTMGRDDAAARIPPFDAIALDLDRWWLP